MIAAPAIVAIASEVAGRPVAVNCDDPSTFDKNVLGIVLFVNGSVVATIHLPTGVCRRLATLATSDSIDSMDVLAFSHEIQHVALDSTDECIVEKTAVANAWQVVRRMKLAAWRAKVVMSGLADADAALTPNYRGC